MRLVEGHHLFRADPPDHRHVRISDIARVGGIESGRSLHDHELVFLHDRNSKPAHQTKELAQFPLFTIGEVNREQARVVVAEVPLLTTRQLHYEKATEVNSQRFQPRLRHGEHAPRLRPHCAHHEVENSGSHFDQMRYRSGISAPILEQGNDMLGPRSSDPGDDLG